MESGQSKRKKVARISRKVRDKEMAEAQVQRRDELTKDYLECEKARKDLGITRPLHNVTLEEYVERGLREWKESLPKEPTGKYQDPAKLRSEYYQKFVQFIIQEAPQVIEELRPMGRHFTKFFGESADRYGHIFNKSNDPLFDLDEIFSQVVQTDCTRHLFLSFRSERFKTLDHNFIWAEYRPMLLAVRLMLRPQPPNLEALADSFKEEVENLTSIQLPNDAKYKGKPTLDTLNTFLKLTARETLNYFLDPEKHKFFLETAKRSFKSLFTNVFAQPNHDFDVELQEFLDLQLNLLEWADRYNLRKDWLLQYAFEFIRMFSKNPKLAVKDIEVPALLMRTLTGHRFEFDFDGWSAGDERRVDYEPRLRAHFETELTRYFDWCSRWLRLDEHKKQTKPRNLEGLKWLVWACVEGLSKSEILDRIAERSNNLEILQLPEESAVHSAFQDFRALNLPIPK